MWCLVHLETAVSSSVSRLLKTNGFEVHIANDVDDLLDQLWFYGSDVACIILEAEHLTGLDDFTDAIQDWPDIPVLAYGSIVKSIDPSFRNIHCGDFYSVDRLAHDIYVFDRRHAATDC